MTHAYFPALGACCATLEYFAGLHRGNLRRVGWQQIAVWAQEYLRQPDYDRETVRLLFEAFRHPGWLHDKSDCSRTFGLGWGAVSAPGHHGHPRAGSQSLARP